jgi:transcriptional regulator with PAS, ATPase and Fis domain
MILGDPQLLPPPLRQDLYYRLCADVIRTPTLREQIADSPQELPGLISILSRRIVGEEDADALAREVMNFVTRHLRRDYLWPGNVRELEQCVRNVMIRGEYHPAHMTRAGRSSPDDDLADLIRNGSLSAEELLSRYCTHV